MNVLTLIFTYLILINLIGFLIMGFDKRRAIKKMFRIPESTLFLIAIIGGGVGSIIGMYHFRHKTKHSSFVYGIPIILIIQLLFVLFLYISPIEFYFL
ncbi:MAG: DUF1294 domain-containing protein [Lachnospiraceae bacterium]